MQMKISKIEKVLFVIARVHVAFESEASPKPGKVRSSRAEEKRALLPPLLCNRAILGANSSRATRESEVNLCGVHRVCVHTSTHIHTIAHVRSVACLCVLVERYKHESELE